MGQCSVFCETLSDLTSCWCKLCYGHLICNHAHTDRHLMCPTMYEYLLARIRQAHLHWPQGALAHEFALCKQFLNGLLIGIHKEIATNVDWSCRRLVVQILHAYHHTRCREEFLCTGAAERPFGSLGSRSPPDSSSSIARTCTAGSITKLKKKAVHVYNIAN